MDRFSRQKINKETVVLNDTLDKIDLIYIFTAFHAKAAEYTFFKKKRLFIFREGKGGRETSMCGCLSSAPYWGPGRQPRHVPWLGIELATLWLAGCHSIHWATPDRAEYTLFSSTHGIYSRIDHMLEYKRNLNKFEKIEIISSIFSDHNAIKLATNYKKKNWGTNT